jgi:hypothetical protein
MEYKARLFGWDERRLKEMVAPHFAVIAAAAPVQPAAAPAPPSS